METSSYHHHQQRHRHHHHHRRYIRRRQHRYPIKVAVVVTASHRQEQSPNVEKAKARESVAAMRVPLAAVEVVAVVEVAVAVAEVAVAVIMTWVRQNLPRAQPVLVLPVNSKRFGKWKSSQENGHRFTLQHQQSVRVLIFTSNVGFQVFRLDWKKDVLPFLSTLGTYSDSIIDDRGDCRNTTHSNTNMITLTARTQIPTTPKKVTLHCLQVLLEEWKKQYQLVAIVSLT